MERQQMQCDQAVKDSVGGLDEYWKHSYSSERQYQFYTVLRFCAAESQLFHAARGLLLRSIEIMNNEAPEDRLLSAMLHLRMAKLLLEHDQLAEAEVEATTARKLLALIPASDRTRQEYEARTRIDLAEFELRRIRAKAALAELEPVRSVLGKDKFLQLAFYKTAGDARLQLGQLDQAEELYRNGIAIAEQPLNAPFDAYDERRVHWVRATDGVYRGLVQVLLARREDKLALQVWEWVRRRAISSYQPVGQFLSLNFQKTQLPLVSEPHLIYASFEDHLDVWIVQGNMVQRRTVAVKRKELVRLTQEFIHSCGDASSPMDLVDLQAEALYQMLLQPVIRDLPPTQKVVVEVDQSFSNLPMEALRSPEGKYFGLSYQLIYSPGMLVEESLNRPYPLKTDDHVLVVDTSPMSGERVLPGHNRPTDAIARFYPDRVVIRTEAAGDLAAITKELKRSAVFQFMGHARRGPSGIALELRPDLYLRSQDISGPMLTNLRLVVLAACSTGGSESGMLDSGNMVRALLRGGVPNVAASHWDVDSNSTGEFFRTFYLHMGAGETASQALLSARASWLASHQGPDPLRHPYYWTAFSMYGRAE